MKLLKKYLAAVAVISALGVSGSANATLTNWYVDSDGAGANAPVLVSDYLDLNGKAYVHNTFTSATTFTFNEVGTFITNLADATNDISPRFDSVFEATGSGTTGGLLSFDTGKLTVKSGATTIGVFNLLSGSANLNANSTLPNGTVSVIFEAVSLVSGYFFDSGMTDLSTILLTNPLVFGFATTNAVDQSPLVVPDTLVDLYNAAFNPDVTGPIVSNITTDLLIGNSGQFRLQVPEPGSLALVGIALLGLASRRKSS